VIIADHKFDSLHRALPQTHQQLAPTGSTFPLCQFHRQQIGPPFLVDADGHQHGLAEYRSVFTHLLVARIQDQIRMRSSIRRGANFSSSSAEPPLPVLRNSQLDFAHPA